MQRRVRGTPGGLQRFEGLQDVSDALTIRTGHALPQHQQQAGARTGAPGACGRSREGGPRLRQAGGGAGVPGVCGAAGRGGQPV